MLENLNFNWLTSAIGIIAGVYYSSWFFGRVKHLLNKHHYRTWKMHKAFVASIDQAAELALQDTGYFVSVMWMKLSRCLIIVSQFIFISIMYGTVFWLTKSTLDSTEFRLISYLIIAFWAGMICFILFLKLYSINRIARYVAERRRDDLRSKKVP